MLSPHSCYPSLPPFARSIRLVSDFLQTVATSSLPFLPPNFDDLSFGQTLAQKNVPLEKSKLMQISNGVFRTACDKKPPELLSLDWSPQMKEVKIVKVSRFSLLVSLSRGGKQWINDGSPQRGMTGTQYTLTASYKSSFFIICTKRTKALRAPSVLYHHHVHKRRQSERVSKTLQVVQYTC